MHKLSSWLFLIPVVIGSQIQSACYAQDSLTPSSIPAKQDSCVVAGRVISASTGEPLRKSYVSLTGAGLGRYQDESEPPERVAITDADGRFVIDGLPPGRYKFRIEHLGFVSREYAQLKPDRPGAILALAPGQEITDLVFRLIKTAVIRGQIEDENGEPAEAADVRIFKWTNRSGKPNLTQAGEETTNDVGEYRASGLSPGRYYVLASFLADNPASVATKGITTTVSAGDFSYGYAPTFYPGSAEVAQATPILVTAGADISGINIRALPNRTYWIKGHISNFSSFGPGQVIVRAESLPDKVPLETSSEACVNEKCLEPLKF